VLRIPLPRQNCQHGPRALTRWLPARLNRVVGPQITLRMARTEVEQLQSHWPILVRLTCSHHMQRRLAHTVWNLELSAQRHRDEDLEARHTYPI
jgi:hypothetical protein